jgi:hypothetical protein
MLHSKSLGKSRTTEQMESCSLVDTTVLQNEKVLKICEQHCTRVNSVLYTWKLAEKADLMPCGVFFLITRKIKAQKFYSMDD